MINLLPEQEKIQLKKEYGLRRLAVALSLLLSLGIIANILFFPSYILMYYKDLNSKSTSRLKPSADQTAERAKLTGQIQLANKILTALKPDTNAHVALTKIISIIDEDKTSDNIITNILFNPSADGMTYQVSVQGIAKNRTTLQGFATTLRNEPSITKVDLPISNFAQDTSISFTITITGKTNS